MTTPTITPNTDKAQVFAGVRKLSDAAAGILLETSSNAVVNAGSLYLAAPENAAIRYAAFSRGSAETSATQRADFLGDAPDTAVIVNTHDIAASLTTVRKNGVAVGSATGNKGTGNYPRLPYVHRRAQRHILFFNGYIDQLITRFGTNLDSGRNRND
jgi:hypothetical protein